MLYLQRTGASCRTVTLASVQLWHTYNAEASQPTRREFCASTNCRRRLKFNRGGASNGDGSSIGIHRNSSKHIFTASLAKSYYLEVFIIFCYFRIFWLEMAQKFIAQRAPGGGVPRLGRERRAGAREVRTCEATKLLGVGRSRSRGLRLLRRKAERR